MRRLVLLLLIIVLWDTLGLGQPAGNCSLPLTPKSIRFAVIGDSGTGGKDQYELAEQLTKFQTQFPFEFTIMLGDNLYGSKKPTDYEKKFERPYRPLLDSGVKFYAALGNHDDQNERFYKLFNMDGQRYYSLKLKDNIRFFALDSNYMDPRQVEWLEKELRNSGTGWKICFFHHPLYSSGKAHGPTPGLRSLLEPLFTKYGVNVVFTGHEHIYERLKPQRGIYYFTSGAAGKVRRDDIKKTDVTIVGYDKYNHFMVVEIVGDEMYFQAISQRGEIIDCGVLNRLS